MTLFKNLESDIDQEHLLIILLKRLDNFFIISDEERNLLRNQHLAVLDRLVTCISGIDNKYFKRNNNPFFSHIHSGQYLIYLYFYSNLISKVDKPLGEKLYYLNKILHGVDIYPDLELPKVFFFEHPLGLVLGRAQYGNNFFAMQGCTVGGNKNCYPIIGENVKMFSNSKILGNSTVGDNVWLSANTYVKDTDIPSNSIVFGSRQELVIKQR